MNKKKKSFIIDYGCCLPYGHHLNLVSLYKKKEKSRGREVKVIVCNRAKKFNQDIDFEHILPALYIGLVLEATENKIVRLFLKFKAIIIRFPFMGKSRLVNWVASASVKKLFNKYDFGRDDLLIFPSADYFGVRALLEELHKIRPEARPKVHLRFLGTLESPVFFSNAYLPDLIKSFNIEKEIVTISTEVSAYSDYLNTLFPNYKIIPEPFPVLVDAQNTKEQQDLNKEAFTVLLPGSNRADKGYFDIFHLAKEALFEFPSIKFIVQDMKRQNPHYNRKYQHKLKQLVNLDLKNAVLSKGEMEKLYQQADLILLPYNPNIYHFRGSGIHYEAIKNHIPVLVKKGVGFAEEVHRWSSGWTYETKQDLLQYLGKVMAMSQKDRTRKMKEAFNNFKQSSDEAYHYYLS